MAAVYHLASALWTSTPRGVLALQAGVAVLLTLQTLTLLARRTPAAARDSDPSEHAAVAKPPAGNLGEREDWRG